MKNLLAVFLLLTGPANGQELSDYFGFDPSEVIKVDHYAGPMAVADLNGDGLNDILVANNRKSRIELHYQKRDAQDTGLDVPADVNEFPEHWRFRREVVVVNHEVGALIVHDVDDDGLMDFVYTGRPAEIVCVRQVSPGVFRVTHKERVTGLATHKDALRIENVTGDSAADVAVIADGRVEIYGFEEGALRLERSLPVGDGLAALWIEDVDGDGSNDVIAALPDDTAPLRIWLGEAHESATTPGPQLRFRLPPLVEVEPVRLAGQQHTSLAYIERPSRRVVVAEVSRASNPTDTSASVSWRGLTGRENRDRDVIVCDVDGDGNQDLIATDSEANAVVVHHQRPDVGLSFGKRHPSFAGITAVTAGNVDDDPEAEVFVLSEKESVVGRSDAVGARIPYPQPMPLPPGTTPVTMGLVTLRDEPRLAVVVKQGRDHQLALIRMNGERETVDLGPISRSPDTIIGLDADQNGLTDLLLLTRDKPMIMIEHRSDGLFVRESADMGQFGLVQAATGRNTAIFDIDADGRDELLIADSNFIRAVRYVETPPAGVSPGWQVVDQVNADRTDSQLVAVTVQGRSLLAADEANARLVAFVKVDESWEVSKSLPLSTMEFESIHAGAFSGDNEAEILAVGEDGFAVIRIGGSHHSLVESAAWQSGDERRFQHELTAGDVNADGLIDLVSLDAGQQMLEILTFSEAGNMLYATGFQVFESRVFSAGEARQFEPSQSIVADVTGDGANDVVLLIHDRILIYPQMTEH